MAPAIATISDNPVHRRHHRGLGISPGLTRAKVAREPKPPAPPPVRAEPKPAPVAAPENVKPSIELEGRVLATFATYEGLQKSVRARVDELRLTRLEVDELSGNQPGYSSKLLCQPPMKRFGRQSLGDTLGAVGVFFALVESSEQVAKLRAVADALSTLGGTAAAALDEAAAALGISGKEFKQIACLAAAPTNMGLLGGALISAGCKMALVEDPEATAKIEARAKKRQRPLRSAPMEP